MEPIDIFITTYLRQAYTERTIEYLYERTKYPFRLFIIDNGGNDDIINELIKQNKVFLVLRSSANMGIHAAWNTALALAESKYFITSDNDIYVPDVNMITSTNMGREINTDWLIQMINFMDERPDYGAISLHPHVIIGNVSEDPNDPEDVKEVDHAGAVMRIMRTQAVRDVGGWEHKIESGRNHEEKWISGKLRENGWKLGRTTRLRAFHPFGPNWGYPEEFTPEMQKHNPNLKDYVNQFNNMDAYDNKTWLPK